MWFNAAELVFPRPREAPDCCFLSEQNVVRTVIQGGGVQHLITMATSEHMIMQNEALVALGLIAALDLGKNQTLLYVRVNSAQLYTFTSEMTG